MPALKNDANTASPKKLEKVNKARRGKRRLDKQSVKSIIEKIPQEFPPFKLKPFIPEGAIVLLERIEELEGQISQTATCLQASHSLELRAQ